MLASARRPSLAHRARRGEGGVSIVLAMLVLFVILVVVFQVSYDANVELDQAASTVDTTRMRMIADAAALQARSSLLMDIENAEGMTDDGGGSADMGMIGGGGGGEEGEGEGGEEAGDEGDGTGSDVSDVIGRTDSKLDEWQDSVSLQPPLGNDYTLWVEVEDEDSKINLLGLWSGDLEQREPQKEIVRNLLDKAFEGTSLDLSYTDATEILDKLDDWVKGNRGSFDPFPTPSLKKSNAEEEAEGGTLDTGILDDSAKHYPLTLGELRYIDGLRAEHLSGFIEDDAFYPGLETYLTVWSQLEIKPEPPASDDPFSGSPFTQGSLFDKPGPGSGSSSSSEEGGSEGESGEGETPADSDVLPTNNGLVNINTVTMPVLRAIAPDDIPTTFLERILEFRENINRLRTEGKLSDTKSLFDDATGGSSTSTGDEDEDEGSGAGSDVQDDDDPTKYVFEKPEDVIAKVEEEYGIELKVEPDIETTFVGRLAVTSQVFTIKVLVRDTKTGRRTSWRTIVWRQQAGEETVLLPLIPLEPYYDARRLKDFPEDFAEQSQDRFQRWTEQGYRAP